MEKKRIATLFLIVFADMAGASAILPIPVVVFSFGVGIILPTLQSLLTRQGPESMAGRMLGWYQSMFSLSLIFGPVWSGWVFEAVTPQAVFMVSAGLMILALILSLSMQRLLRVQSLHHHHEPAGVHFHH